MGDYRQEKPKKKDSAVRNRQHELRQAADFDEMMDLENELNLNVLSGLKIRPKNKFNKKGKRP